MICQEMSSSFGQCAFAAGWISTGTDAMVRTRNASRAQPTGLQATSLVAWDVGRHLAKEVAAGRTGSNSTMPEHIGTILELVHKGGCLFPPMFLQVSQGT